MTRRLRLSACAAGLALSCAAPLASAQNLMNVRVTDAGQSDVSQAMSLPINKSAIVELSRPAADIVISNPEVADAYVQSSSRLIFRGINTGKTNAFIFDQNGNAILNLEITVEQDISDLQTLLNSLLPDARVKVEGINGNIVISGTVENLGQADEVMRVTRGYLPSDETEIVNLLSVTANDQVMLKVQIVEMQRSVIKQLGINLQGQLAINGGDPFTANLTSAPQFGVQGQPLAGLNAGLGYVTTDADGNTSSIGASLNALERVGVVRTLAEPNLTAVSGESANFLAGGEFPVPVGQDEDGVIQIEFKQFGVGLGFTPIVLSEDRISLKVSTEVSELTFDGAFQGNSATFVDPDGQVQTLNSLTIPALKVRRAQSTVELPSGGSMMIAGLIQSDTRQILDGIPGAKDIPVLGSLFRSRDFVNDETELVVIITPYLVDPANPNQLRSPADGYANAADRETNFFGKLNAVYGQPGRDVDAGGYTAPVGFIEE